jgi:two-component system, chemotaxis family, sensor kinase CheA
MTDSNLDAALEAFIAEARELMDRIEAILVAAERGSVDTETINELFRAAHTIKGSAGLFGLDAIVAFTHVVESALDKVRGGIIPLGAELVACLLECNDQLRGQVEQIDSGGPADTASLSERSQGLVVRLEAICGPVSRSRARGVLGEAPVATLRPDAQAGAIVAADTWHISLRFSTEVLRNGLDPLAFIRYLRTFGQIVATQVLTDSMPTPDGLDAESCYLGFEIGFRTEADKARIEAAFEFVRDESRIRILPPRSRVADYVDLIHAQSGDDARLGQLLVSCGSLTQRELADALSSQAQVSAASPKPLGEVLIEQGVVHAPVVEAALAKQSEQAASRTQKDAHSIRIDAIKLDKLIDLVGELSLLGAGAAGDSRQQRQMEAGDTRARFSRLVEEIRASALQLRMVPIGTVFSKFQRVVRDVSRELGKDIQLTMTGVETELDKSLVELINDPLMHLVRNAIDHGIESAETRVASGKAERGTLRLSAAQEGGSVVIQVGDDGAGIHRDKVLAKARQRGLLGNADTPSDQDIINLILQPGFSTAETVTNLSGRGVGMDVVKRNIEQLRGTLEIESAAGEGTTFRIRLPLTLAIIEGFLVRVGGFTYVLPLELVEECIEAAAPRSDDGVIELRGCALPVLHLHEVFGTDAARTRRRAIVVVRSGGRRVGLIVDELLGKFQAVIKPLSPVFAGLAGVIGSSILGDGTIALILDIPDVLRLGAALRPAHPHSLLQKRSQQELLS